MSFPRSRFLDRTTPPHIFTLVVMAGLSAMSMNMFLPALPTMAAHFETDYKVMQLSVAIFLAMNAVLQLIIGPLADRFGRRPVVMAGTIIFILASFGTIYAPTVGTFLTMRAVQAAIVTGMVLSRAIVRDMHPEDEAATMIAYVTMGMSVVPMIAPTVGGFLTTAFGWHANFWVLAVCGIGLLILVFFDQGETAPPQADRSLRAMVTAFPELLASQRFLGYALSAAAASGAFFAYIGGAPFVGTTLFGLPENMLGLYMGAPAIGYFFGNFCAGRYSARFGVNLMVLIGALCPDRLCFAQPDYLPVGCLVGGNLFRLHDPARIWQRAAIAQLDCRLPVCAPSSGGDCVRLGRHDDDWRRCGAFGHLRARFSRSNTGPCRCW